MTVLLCSMPFGKTTALTLPEEEPVLVYYMPLTQLQLTAEYDEVVTEVGQFYQYSERYLGTKDVVTKAEKHYVLTGISFRPTAGADTTRAYILQDKNIKLQLLHLSPFGTLVGYNLPQAPAPAMHPDMPMATKSSESLVGTGATRLMPLLEEQLMASSKAKMAEGAAKQIYRIREMRLNLLAGEVDKAPADGDALKQMLAEMDKREQELTALFVGRTNVIHHVQHFSYTPNNKPGKQEESILFRFSKHYGVVATDDLSGEPVTLRLSKSMHQLVQPDKPAQKAAGTLYYNLPASGELTVTYGEQQLINHPVDIAQWGVSVPLSNALIATTPRITFCPLTGNIVSIEK